MTLLNLMIEAAPARSSANPFAELSLASLLLAVPSGLHLLLMGHGWHGVLACSAGIPCALAISAVLAVWACVQREWWGLSSLSLALVSAAAYFVAL